MAYLLHHLLSESAARLPEKEAVRFEGQGLSYSDLDGLTNQLARALKIAGVNRGDRVGIYVHKSLASIISVFGIMKAGGVYVPLDANAPVKRLTFITQNCGIKVLLTSTELLMATAKIISSGAPIDTVIMTDDQSEQLANSGIPIRLMTLSEVLAQERGTLPAGDTIETDLAYILYTSGSTGEPKGVMISHRTIFTFINWCYEKFGMTQDDRVTSHAPLHFDLSTFDIYVTIKAGGTVVLLPEKLSIFPVGLADLLQNERITVTYLVPSILSLMVNYGKLDAHDFSDLRTLLFAGEIFPIKYLRQLVEAIPHVDYFNLYGPTETNVCTYYKVLPQDISPNRVEPVPIGSSCENMEVFAVNDEGELVTEPDQEGELWVRGSCLAQGYWGDSQKTAKNFVPNPFEPHFQELAYRTGDIVKLAEDRKNWIYIGRRDHMIKSRGYRIELGEIESVLYNHRSVKEAAVVAVPDDLIGNRIKAFVVPLNDYQLTGKEIELFCIQHLPRYMVPEVIEIRRELAKTSSGKINRTLLVSNL